MASVSPSPASMSPVVVAVAVVAAAAAVYFRAPAAVVLLIGFVVAGWFSVAPSYTGPKDATGYPTPAGPGETKKMRQHRVWTDLRWKLLIPSQMWLPNPVDELDRFRPSQTSSAVPKLLRKAVEKVPATAYLLDVVGVAVWLLLPSRFTGWAALGAAAAAATLPTDAIGSAWVWGNALAAYVLVVTVAAVTRAHADLDEPSDGVMFAALATRITADRGRIRAVVAFGFLSVSVALAAYLGIMFTEIDWLITPAPVFGAGVGVIAYAAVLHFWMREEALTPWRNTIAARAAWKPRWEGLKQNPHLVSHERVGANETPVDTFEAPPVLASRGAIALQAKLLPFMGSGVKLAMLTSPDTDGEGQPVPGSMHPTRFRVVTWQPDAFPNVTDPTADAAEVALFLESVAYWAVASVAMPQPILLDAKPLSDNSAEGATAAWVSTWVSAENFAASSLGAAKGSMAEYLDEVYVHDPDGVSTLYFGAVTADTTKLTNPRLLERLEELAVEARWELRWRDLLKVGAKPPALQYAFRKEARLNPTTVIQSQPFLVKQGLDPTEFFTQQVRKGLATTLKAAPFVTVTGFPVQGARPGDRHAQGLTVIWSERPVPSSPSEVPPGAEKQAQKWALAGSVNDAFDAAKLNRPELISVTPLTHRDGFTHIWKITLRLYDGVTSAMVKANAEKIRLAMGACSWLRVTESVDGCDIYAGADPKSPSVEFAAPKKENRDKCIALDWEQAFIDAKVVSAADGSAPKLVRASVLPTNTKVQVLEFTIPRGVQTSFVKEARLKLGPATGNEFLEVRPGSSNETFTLLACAVNPMPFPAQFDWDYISASAALPFGTGVEGEPITFDWKEDPHLLVLGGSGSGKSATLQVFLTGAILRDCEVYLADPTKLAADFRYAEPWMKAITIDELETSAMMDAVYDEVKRRKNLNGQYGAASFTDLPEDVRPKRIVVFIDEFTSLMMPDKPARLTGNESEQEQREHAAMEAINDAKRNIGAKAGRLAREARSAGVTLILATQTLKADTLASIPGGSSLKDNLARLVLGKTSFGQLQSALKEPTEAPDLGAVIPRGRGVFESSASKPQTIQSWYDPDHLASMTQRLRDGAAVLTADEKLDLSPYLKAVNEGPVFGERIVTGGALDDDDDTVIDIDELDLGDLTFEDAGEVELVIAFDEPTGTDEIEFVSTCDTALLLGVTGVLTFTDDSHGQSLISTDVSERLAALPVDAVWLSSQQQDTNTRFHSLLGRELPSLPDKGDTETGWWKLDAAAQLLRVQPGIRRVIWVDHDLHAEDAIGVPYAALADEVFTRAGVQSLAIAPAAGLSADDLDRIDAFLAIAPEPAVVAPDVTDLFADAPVPAPQTPPVNLGLFDDTPPPAARTTTTTTTTTINFD